jgi:hypothetical protein
MYTCTPESIECIIEDKAFLPSYDLAPSPPPPSCQQVASLSQSSCVSPVELTDGIAGGGEEKEPNHTTARKPGPL